MVAPNAEVPNPQAMTQYWAAFPLELGHGNGGGLRAHAQLDLHEYNQLVHAWFVIASLLPPPRRLGNCPNVLFCVTKVKT